jgi:hypothetical protein
MQARWIIGDRFLAKMRRFMRIVRKYRKSGKGTPFNFATIARAAY